jgi:hypothetical protein
MSNKMIRVNAIYGRGNPIPVGKNKFYRHIVLKNEDDPYIPGTKIGRLRLANLGEGVRVGFADEIDAIAEGLRAERDGLAERARAARAPAAAGRERKKKKQRARAQAAAQ